MQFKAGLTLLFSFFLFSTATVNAQDKFGHLNLTKIVEEYSQKKQINAKLESYTAPKKASLEGKVKSFEKRVAEFISQAESGQLSQAEIQTRQQELQEEEKTLIQEDEKLTFSVIQKREELVAPVLEDIQNAINTIAKEGGYQMVFDSGLINAVLVTPSSGDLGPAVRKKLGI